MLWLLLLEMIIFPFFFLYIRGNQIGQLFISFVVDKFWRSRTDEKKEISFSTVATYLPMYLRICAKCKGTIEIFVFGQVF